MEERFVLLSENDPSDVDWTLSLLHFAKYAGIGRVVQLRGLYGSGPVIREIARECRATGVRLDVLGDRDIPDLERDRDGSFLVAPRIHTWVSGTNVIWGGKQVALFGSAASIADTTVQEVAEQSPSGADIVLRGMDINHSSDDENLITREHTWRLLRQLRPLLYVHGHDGPRRDSVESLDGRTLVQCGLSSHGGSSVAVLDLRAIQVLS
jgi:hypothetical protein